MWDRLTFLALESGRGHVPVQEVRCFAVGNADISSPISARIVAAVRSLPRPGIVLSKSMESDCCDRVQCLLNRLPVDAGRFHTDFGAVVLKQKSSQCIQP